MFLAAFGGSTVVMVSAILFIKNKIEKIIDKKIDYCFDTKIENEKGVIEQKVYVSQHKFDKEYEIIQALMERVFDFTYLSWDVYCTIGESEENDRAIKKYQKACDEFTLLYMRNCAFIPEELATTYDLFVKKINEFRSAVNRYNKLLIRDSTSFDEEKQLEKILKVMENIHDELNKRSDYSYDTLIEVTRKYYDKLEIK